MDSLWLRQVDVGDEVVVALHVDDVLGSVHDFHRSAHGAGDLEKEVPKKDLVDSGHFEACVVSIIDINHLGNGLWVGSEVHGSFSVSHWCDVSIVTIHSVEENIAQEFDTVISVVHFFDFV
jgi:hypothetical protein